MLTLSQKSDIRRHLKYPVAGLVKVSPAGGTLASGAAGWRFFGTYGFLEYKMNNLNPDEECRITGNIYGAIMFLGGNPAVGDTITVTLTGGGLSSSVPVSVTATSTDTPLSLAAGLAAQAALNQTLMAAKIGAVAPYGNGAWSQNLNPAPEMAFVGPSLFSLALSSTGSGNTGPVISAYPEQLPPAAVVNSSTQLNGYLPMLNYLEGQIVGASDNLDTIMAGTWKARRTEVEERQKLYDYWCYHLAEFLDIPLNPHPNRYMKRGGGSMRGVV